MLQSDNAFDSSPLARVEGADNAARSISVNLPTLLLTAGQDQDSPQLFPDTQALIKFLSYLCLRRLVRFAGGIGARVGVSASVVHRVEKP